MSLSRNNIYKYFYLSGLFLLLIILSLILNDNFNLGSFRIFPNMEVAGLVFISAYLDIYAGWFIVYALFYIYGAMTPLNPAVFGLTGTVAYAASYVIWRRIPYDNAITEILITFIASLIYYCVLFFVVFYGFGIHFIYWNFLIYYAFPASVSTSVISPAVFFLFKKAGYKNFLNKNKLIYL